MASWRRNGKHRAGRRGRSGEALREAGDIADQLDLVAGGRQRALYARAEQQDTS